MTPLLASVRRRPVGLVLVVLAAAAVSTAVFPLLAPLRAAAQAQPQPAEPPAIAVTGEGRVLVTPDIARVVLGVETRNQSLAAAQAETASRMDAVTATLKAAGVDEKEIRTVQYTVQPLTRMDEQNRRAVSDGFQVTHLVQVTFRDLTVLGRRLDEVTRAGGTTIQGLRFDLADPDAGVRQAREQAVADARSRAEHLARLTGVAVGRPLSISEGGGPVAPQPLRAAPAAGRDAGAAAPTQIEPGQNEVRMTVTIRFAIQ